MLGPPNGAWKIGESYARLESKKRGPYKKRAA